MIPGRVRMLYAMFVFAAMTIAVASPFYELNKPKGVKRHDGFPLSHYPMFSRPRGKTESATYVLAVEADGTRHNVPYTYWTTGGWNQGRGQIHAYRNGRNGGLPALCERLVTAMQQARTGWESRVVELQIVKGTYSRERYFRDGDPLPLKEKLLLSCGRVP